EAAVTDLMTDLSPRHHVLTERDLVAATGRRDGADGVIGYDQRYVVVEASVQTLGRHVAEGSPRAGRSRCREYHPKGGQAEKTASRLPLITRHHDRRTPEAACILVVTDVPLT